RVGFTYDANGNLATVTDVRGKLTIYTYDAGQRLTSVTDPNGHVLFTLTYDAQGRATQSRDAESFTMGIGYSGSDATVTDSRGHPTVFRFDGNARFTGLQDALGATTLLAYDGGNNLTSARDRRGNTTS